MSVRTRAILGPAAAVLLAFLALGCDKEDKIIVQNLPPSQENRPPLIVTYSPTFTPGGFEQVSDFEPLAINLQVLVGDPDGLDDISAVTVDIGSVTLRRYILRPDTSSSFCHKFSYAPNDTVATSSILSVPASFPGVTFRSMAKIGAGLYALTSFGGFPDIFAFGSNLGQWPGGCYDSDGIGGPWVVMPPAIATQNEAILTYLDVNYAGNKITVWDKMGANAVLNLPDLRVVYTTAEEKLAAP